MRKHRISIKYLELNLIRYIKIDSSVDTGGFRSVQVENRYIGIDPKLSIYSLFRRGGEIERIIIGIDLHDLKDAHVRLPIYLGCESHILVPLEYFQ